MVLDDLSSVLDSPIQTLADSIQDPIHEFTTIHDLIDAYSVFSTRLRNLLRTVGTSDSSKYATPLRANSATLTDVICRDIACVLPDSFASPQNSYLDQSSYDDDSNHSVDDPEDEVDSSMLCCYALRVAADICAIPCVLACLTDIERSRLLNAIFEVSRFPKSPIYNWEKINSLVVSLFKFQQLPWDTMRTSQREICVLIQERLQDSSPQHREGAALIVRSMLLRYPKLIKGFVTEYFSTILEQLVDSSSNARIQAASALSAFALLKVKPDVTIYPEEETRKALREFVRKYTDKHRTLQPSNRLFAILRSAMKEEKFWNSQGKAFAIVLAGSIILIEGYQLFSSRWSMAIVYAVISKLLDYQDVHRELWRLSLWAFSRVPSSSDSNSDDTFALWDRAYMIVKQTLDHGLGTQLIYILMRNAEELRNEEMARTVVGKAILLVEEMVQHEDPSVRADGFNALCALLKGIGPEFSIAPHRPKETHQAGIAFSTPLVDGSLFEQKPGQNVDLGRTEVDVNIIKPLSEQDIVDNWDKLADIWVVSAKDVVHGRREFTIDYIRSWQALLLVQTQLTQGNEHLASTPSFCNKIASIVGKLAVQDPSVNTQAKSLSFISKLWNAMKNTFVHEWLSPAAGVIVTSLLSKSFAVDQQDIRDLWAKLCADLIAIGIPTLVHILHARTGGAHGGTEMTRLLWYMLARDRKAPFEDDDWQGMIQFLLVPFGAWDLSDEEFGMWQAVFQSTLGVTEKRRKSFSNVLDHLCRSLDDRVRQGLTHSTKALYSIISKATNPHPELIKLINEALGLNYSPLPEKKTFGLNVLQTLAKMAATVEPDNVVTFLEAIQNSALLWIHDGDRILTDSERKRLMNTFYAQCLDSLSKDAPSISSLEKLEKLVFCCFDPLEQTGLDVFTKFWLATYHKHPVISLEHLPQHIQLFLGAWSDVFEDSMGFSADSDSIVHDSSPRDLRSLRSPDVDEKVDSTFLFEQDPSVLLEPAKGLNRSGTVTPTQSRVWPGDKVVSDMQSALDVRIQELEEETSQDDGMVLANTQSPMKRRRVDESRQGDKKGTEKQDISPAPKRRKTDPDFIPFSLARPKLSTSRSVPVNAQGSVNAQRRGSNSGRSVSGEPSTATTPSWLRSQNNMTRAMTKIGALARGGDGEGQSQRDLAPADDYDDWEQPMSVGQLREVKAEMASSDDIVPDSEEAMPEDEEELPTKYEHDDDGHLISPISSQDLIRSRKRERSQTAPEPGLMLTAQADDSPDRPQSLRRNHTTGGPLQNKKSTSAQQLEVLNATYAALSTARESQIDDEDIIQAKEITSKMNLLLEQRIIARLGKNGSKNK
ncbi:armadillo-type protein [Panaeolus papilionaceus]|nr:armadillo-type protein [Panaeolus papilionaceus]